MAALSLGDQTNNSRKLTFYLLDLMINNPAMCPNSNTKLEMKVSQKYTHKPLYNTARFNMVLDVRQLKNGSKDA